MGLHPYFDGPYPRAYAHRGWHIDELTGCENTLAAFRRAVAEGFSYLELDVRASADGVAMVHHDATLDRTAGHPGVLELMPAAEIERILVAGREPVPSLEDVLTELPDVRVTIEIKSAAAVLPTLGVLECTGSWHRVCLGSFNERWLQQAREVAGDRLLTSMAQSSAFGLRGRAWLRALPTPLRSLSLLPLLPPVLGGLAQLPRRFSGLTVVDAALLRMAHESDREVHVWTVDEPLEMTELLDIGADGLLSDRPDLLRAVLRERGAWA
ncbi:glycerophosphodiester phosphodiesterase family protein [Pseudonocardia asaccharolytica]|uniref:Glycerophosphoryl diester phosphodiesterase n=1 Tax=Pseudonocardia asaccharolytica DSM 44247 = NBRC 16224 TaxID=1123024 RepID=A0A511D6J2_9PSEU|nr:glycerophosphodiester phosphodiesterase family protein [Pseudonocardia asaccharolytica]GEL20410.1 glycerophosphoryl diester phosphodiesterase [Pseudonocardia asaccharolytica DSM 44247 = NBRC 16224]